MELIVCKVDPKEEIFCKAVDPKYSILYFKKDKDIDVRYVLLWWTTLMLEEAVDMWLKKGYGKSLYLSLNFAAKLKLL